MNRLLVLLAVVLSGCSSFKEHELDSRWEPLERILQADLPYVSDTAITTLGDSCYVENLDSWLWRHPPGSTEFDAIMTHEQIHAKRQQEAGELYWVTRYLADTEFALKEEKLGWAAELRHRRVPANDYYIDHYAKILSEYKNAVGSLISYEDARVWVREVLTTPEGP